MQVKLKPQLHASWIEPYAREIVQTLQKKGFTSYLVGGCVRDLLVGIHPKDYDIATNASPQEVKRSIPHSYIIGRRFRLVLVKRRQHQFEVATFRRESRPEDFQDLPEGMEAPSGDNFFGTPEEDALRRDFSVNALFYDPVADQLIDYANGMSDINDRTLRMIGDPDTRIVEDPIRILRALRLAHKVGFRIEESLRAAMSRKASELSRAALPRKREEYIKILRLPEPTRAWMELWDLGVLSVVLPSLDPIFNDPARLEVFLHYINRSDEVCMDSQSPTELFAPVIWGFTRAMEDVPDMVEQRDILMKRDLNLFKAEQAEILAAFELMPKLSQIDVLQRRGARRQQGFFDLPQLPLALRIASVDCLLGFEEMKFWKQQWQANAKPVPEFGFQPQRNNNRRRRPQRNSERPNNFESSKTVSNEESNSSNEDAKPTP